MRNPHSLVYLIVFLQTESVPAASGGTKQIILCSGVCSAVGAVQSQHLLDTLDLSVQGYLAHKNPPPLGPYRRPTGVPRSSKKASPYDPTAAYA